MALEITPANGIQNGIPLNPQTAPRDATGTSLDSKSINSEFASNRFFTVGDRPQVAGLNNILNSAPYLKPVGSGLVDIVNDFTWKNAGSTDEIPSIYATELELEFGTWIQNLARLITVGQDLANGKTLDSYLKLYATKNTGFWYNFPWLLTDGDNIRNVRSSWTKAQGIADVLESGGKTSALGSVIGGFLGAANAGFGFEDIYQYGETTRQSLTLKFPLYNTLDSRSAYDNYTFVSLFTFQNLKTRTSMMTFIPPKLYTLDSRGFGGIYWPVAFVSDLKIDSIGTTRTMSGFGGGSQPILIPEAYKVSITFEELLPQSSNIFGATMGASKISVTGPIPESERKVVNGLNNKIGETVSAIGKGLQTAGQTLGLTQPPSQ